MKTKTTLAALLLAAVMVTPSYGANASFMDGAELYHNGQTEIKNANFFVGYVTGVVQCAYKKTFFNRPDKATYGQLCVVVAKHIHDHPEDHHKPMFVLVVEAFRDAWPDDNKVVVGGK